MSPVNWLRSKILAIRPHEVAFQRMGARIDPPQVPGLQKIADSLRTGFNLTLEDDRLDGLTERVAAAVDPGFVGFAHEGVGMCLALLDEMWNADRAPRFLERCRGTYDIFVMLGIGFAWARVPWTRRLEGRALRLPAPYDGMIFNGYGFHEACFKSGGVIENTPRPSGLSESPLRAFDHGLGRAVWFMCGGSPSRIAETVARFDASRRPDVWAGLGTACAYAGRAYADMNEYARVLRELSAHVGDGENREPFSIGVVLAAELVRRTRHETPWVAHATESLLGLNFVEAGAVAERAWTEAERLATSTPFSMYASYAGAMGTQLASARASADASTGRARTA
jgi:enediyne biosynthesis protein E3